MLVAIPHYVLVTVGLLLINCITLHLFTKHFICCYVVCDIHGRSYAFIRVIELLLLICEDMETLASRHARMITLWTNSLKMLISWLLSSVGLYGVNRRLKTSWFSANTALVCTFHVLSASCLLHIKYKHKKNEFQTSVKCSTKNDWFICP